VEIPTGPSMISSFYRFFPSAPPKSVGAVLGRGRPGTGGPLGRPLPAAAPALHRGRSNGFPKYQAARCPGLLRRESGGRLGALPPDLGPPGGV